MQGEYINNARDLDRRYRSDHKIEECIKSHGPILPLVFGAFGEVNSRFNDLVDALAAHGSTNHWRTMLADNATDAKAPLIDRIRCSLGMAIHRANSDLILNRVNYVGPHAAGAATRRAQQEQRWWGGEIGSRRAHRRTHAWRH